MSKKDRTAGIMTMELVLSLSLAAFAGFWMVSWMRRPAMVQQMMLSSDRQRQLDHATGVLVNDLAEADPSSIGWSNLPISSSTAGSYTFLFWKTIYDVNSPSVPQIINYQYQIVPDGTGTGSLVRTVSQGSTTISKSNVLTTVNLPDGAKVPPLIQADKANPSDSGYSILIVNLQYQPAGTAPLSIVRRVSMAM